MIRWHRLVPPFVLALIGLSLLLAHPLLEQGTSLAITVAAFGRACLIGAAGWLTGLIIDWRLRVAIARADISVPDNLSARKLQTRIRMLRRVAAVLIAVLTVSLALMSMPMAREVGLSLFASAGVAGLVIGIAAQPVLANLIAGLQIAITQPIRIDDAVVVEGEWGWIEDIGLFHVIIRLWDERRLVTPLNYFNQNTFQNWTKESASIIGSVFWSLDYRAPLAEMREKLSEFCKENRLWDGRVCVLQVTGASGDSIELRALASARTSPDAWDLRCDIRERMIVWLQDNYPEALPVRRTEANVRVSAQEAWGTRLHTPTPKGSNLS
jgi:small-conductance mechanosensitive channel